MPLLDLAGKVITLAGKHAEVVTRELAPLLFDIAICPKCGVISAPFKTSRNRLVCQSCKHQASVTAGTIFDKTRTPLKVWLAAGWYITNQKQGVSALGLQRVLGLGSYQTAWAMLHRFRRAMIRPGRDLLIGRVEVDETFIAIGDKAQPANAKGRKSHTTKTLVVIGVEMLEPKGFGRIRLRRISDDSERQVIPFVKEVIQAGATVHTDGSVAYRSLKDEGYVVLDRKPLSPNGNDAVFQIEDFRKCAL